MLTGQECERSRRQQALHCGHSGKSLQRGRRVATGLRGYGACEAAEGVVQKSGAKDESSRSGTLTFNGTHASELGAAARKVEWGPALREFENFVGSRFTPACNTSVHATASGTKVNERLLELAWCCCDSHKPANVIIALKPAACVRTHKGSQSRPGKALVECRLRAAHVRRAVWEAARRRTWAAAERQEQPR